MKEMQSLALDVRVLNEKGDEINLQESSEYEPSRDLEKIMSSTSTEEGDADGQPADSEGDYSDDDSSLLLSVDDFQDGDAEPSDEDLMNEEEDLSFDDMIIVMDDDNEE